MNESAFPTPSGWDHEGKWVQDNCSSNGMTLRDYFAAKVLNGLLSDPECDSGTAELLAKMSYQVADAMLKAREQ